ncbi:MFS transporter [Lactobacillus sp. ESL0731]|uniref:MFS transporter n=1 Tax=unclassified Lactobacillus TaxID=2620435 RepID=UPI0023FA40ED|nr:MULTISPECIES: MFS transporter [unclassified Lactobacillus]WEV50943.1 MFS transporter [Lactobacillus sp. ESL0700]WEV62074.1 MFS transporter [Lactobacillus sp. ESL0731]
MEEKQLPKLSSYRWVILAIAALMDVVSNYTQFQVSALATQIMPALHITPAQYSSLLMAPMLIAVFLSIPAGSLADRFGAKKVVTVGLVVSVIGAFGRLIAHNFITMMIMLLMFGVYMALLNANTIKIFGIWFKQDTNMAMGVFFASASIGIMLSQITGPMFKSINSAYTFSSVLLLILAVCWVLFVRDTPKGEEVPQAQGQQESSMSYFKVAAKSGKVWLIGICGGCCTAAAMAFSGILPQAFAARGMNGRQAGMFAAIATVGSLCGSLFGPAIVGKLKNAKPFMITTTLLSAVLMGITWYVPLGGVLLVTLIFGGLCGAITGPLLQAMPIQFPEIGPKYAGSAGGLVGTMSLLLSYVVPVIISGIAGHNFALTFILQGTIFGLTVIILAILPDANHAGERK